MELLNKLIATTLPWFPKSIVGYLSRHYIAGASVDDAVQVARGLTDEGCCVTMDVLGENIKNTSEANEFARQYLELLDRIEMEKLNANVSVKPTQMGMALDMEVCRNNYRQIIEKAAGYGNFVRIDMEDTPYTDKTLNLHQEMAELFPGSTGVVIQSYLRRTANDCKERLIPASAHLRLCKGIYREPVELAFQSREDIRNSFLDNLKDLLSAGNYVGIATHDEYLVDGALKIISNLDLSKDKYEFQMLLGVMPGLRNRILNDGHKLRVYVPFGEAWFAYSTRRLEENPSLVNHFIKGLFRKH
jgi:proline dehydrogenase